ncbi:hypothetical protein MBANPS3_005104 [Mucor bainieri]
MQPSRNTAGSPSRARPPPAPSLRIDTSHDAIRTPLSRPTTSDIEQHLLSSSSPNFPSRQSAGGEREPEEACLFYNHSSSDPLRESSTAQHRIVGDQISISSSESDPIPGASILSNSMLAPEQVSFTGQHLTREERLRLLQHNATGAFLPGLATFVGEKLVSATNQTKDVYRMAFSFYQQKQYERAIDTLQKRQVLGKSAHCRYLAAQCSLALGKGIDALWFLGPSRPSTTDTTQEEMEEGHLKLESAMCFARGRAYLMEKDIYKARDWFKQALTVDVKCYDALEALVKFNMLEERAEWEFVMTLPYEEHCGADSNYYRQLYRLKLKRGVLKGERIEADPRSVDVQLFFARDYFSQSRYGDCLDVCREIKVQDSRFTESTQLHVSCLYELGLNNQLFEFAHELVKEFEEEAVSWYAVGLYHLCVGKHVEAKRYFSHALALNGFFEPAWHSYALTLSMEKDYDEAIRAYENCSKLILGSHLPQMHLALEYMKLGKLDLAFECFLSSLQKCDHDPFLYNEMAVYYCKQGLYEEARKQLHTALALASERQCKTSRIWEKIWSNLGHVYRCLPLQDYDSAKRCAENALNQNPKNADAHTTLGMVYQQEGNAAKAIAEYLEALKHTDRPALVNELLQSATLDNFKTSYVSMKTPCLLDSFDVSEVAAFIGVKEDPVAIELEQHSNIGDTGGNDDTEGEHHPSVLFTEDAMIIDQGDLTPLREGSSSGEQEEEEEEETTTDPLPTTTTRLYMFTSLSASTHAALPHIVEDEGREAENALLVTDLRRQMEHLQFQMTVTHERNQQLEHELVTLRTTSRDLWRLNDKQSALIDALESKLSQTADMKRELGQLEQERHAMENTLQEVRHLATKQDEDTARALEEMAVLQKQQEDNAHHNTNNDTNNGSSLDQQRTRALENRVEELDNYIDALQKHHTHPEEAKRWRHTAQLQTAKINALEKKLGSLQDELQTYHTALREGDTSGIVASLQDRIQRLQQEKMAVENDFESSFEAAVNENDTLTQLANQQLYQIQQQLDEQQSIKQAYDALKKEYELVEKLNQELVAAAAAVQKQPHAARSNSSSSRQSGTSAASLYRKRRTPHRLSADEKPQLLSWMQEKLETACTMDVLQKVSHLADENMQLALMVDDLETQIMSQRHHLSQQAKTLECDVMNLTVLNSQLERQIESPVRHSRSSAATASTSHGLQREDTPASMLSDYSLLLHKHRSTTPNVPPPTEPPSQPLPPTPPVSEQFDTQLRSYRIKLDMAETQVREQQERIQKLASDMENSQQELQDQHTKVQQELDLERRHRQKAEQAHAILEKRLQQVMSDSKKNKFLCF